MFGDSYADTGNLNKTNTAWKPPYGISFPGKPSGRHSDGKVLADLIASAFKLSTPVPYNQQGSYSNQRLRFGMNFATGGSGIFTTWPGVPNITTQIDQLQRLMCDRVYSAMNFRFSLLLFTVSGNDYAFYILQQRAVEGVPSFVESLIKQLSADLVRLYNLGFRRFAITDMEPLGCLPSFTVDNSHASCNATLNILAVYHNSLLQEAVEGIRKGRADATFVILDQYSDTMAVFQHGKFRKALKPCCSGECGVTDSAGKALYSVCTHPELAFYWDGVHPTQSGWETLMTYFKSSLAQLQT